MRGIWITRSLPGICSARSMMASTTTSSKCLSARRRIALCHAPPPTLCKPLDQRLRIRPTPNRPPPPPGMRVSVLSLREQIKREIQERGPISFSRYMDICLYDPSLGYYSRNAEQFGKGGDFYTSSDVHAVFGRLLARQFEEMWRALDRPPRLEILELGPGRGLFARDVLDWSREKFPDFFAAFTYTLQESSPALRSKLEQTLGNSSRGRSRHNRETNRQRRHSIYSSLPAARNSRDHVRQRVLRCLARRPHRRGRQTLYLAFEESRLNEVWRPISSEEFDFLDRYGVHPEATSASKSRWPRRLGSSRSRTSSRAAFSS